MCGRGWDPGIRQAPLFRASIDFKLVLCFQMYRITLLAVLCVILHYCNCFHAIVETNFGNEARRIIVNP